MTRRRRDKFEISKTANAKEKSNGQTKVIPGNDLLPGIIVLGDRVGNLLVLERVDGGGNAAATVDKSLGREGVDRHDRSMAKQTAP